jgi:hypothetical protein
MRTTLDLPDETFRKLKPQAALSGMKLKELVAQFIERGLAANSAQADQASPHNPLPVAIVRTNYPIPIAREADGSVTPYLSNAQLYAILDEEDLAQYQRAIGDGSAQDRINERPA